MKTLITSLAVVFITSLSFSQLKSSGKTVTKNYDYKNFDKVYF